VEIEDGTAEAFILAGLLQLPFGPGSATNCLLAVLKIKKKLFYCFLFISTETEYNIRLWHIQCGPLSLPLPQRLFLPSKDLKVSSLLFFLSNFCFYSHFCYNSIRQVAFVH